MPRYLIRRLGQALLVVAGVVVLTFVVMRLVPGDPAVAFAGPKATPERARRGARSGSGWTTRCRCSSGTTSGTW